MLLGLGLASLPSLALAQNDDSRTDLSIDRAQDLSDRTGVSALAGTGANILGQYSPKLDPGQRVIYGAVDIATTLNTNPTTANGGSKSSAQFNTKLQLNYIQQYEGLKLSLNSTVEIDRYDEASVSNQDNVISTIKLEFNGVKSDPNDGDPTGPKPQYVYLFYTPTIRQTDDFIDHKGSLHDLGVGFILSNPFNVSGDWKVGLDVNATRRLSDAFSNSTSVIGKLKASYTVTSDLFVSFQPSFRYRAFDQDALGDRRKDKQLIVPLLLSWDPHWLADQKSQLIFGVTATRNWSNVAAKRYRQWNFGPSIQLVKVFP